MVVFSLNAFCWKQTHFNVFASHHLVKNKYTYRILLRDQLPDYPIGYLRDPDRVIPNQPDAIVSPADGKVISVGPVEGTSFYEGSCQKISIFMSVFNVHVNRIPFDGQVKRVGYHPGKFFSANLNKASLQNEHNAVFLETSAGKPLCTVQVAGLIARRIICKVQPGDEVRKGQRFGMICFGSRLDVYLPDDVETKVSVGDKVKAGSSVIGRFAMS